VYLQVYILSIYSVWQTADIVQRLGARGHFLFDNEGSMSHKGSEGKQASVWTAEYV